jgi:hypothetical protein
MSKTVNWKSSEVEHSIILHKLIMNGESYTTGLEKDQKSSFNPRSSEIADKSIPHTSLPKRLQELEEQGKIHRVYSTEKSKKGLEIKKYRISLWGLIQTISQYDLEAKSPKDIEQLLLNSSDLIQWISQNWNDLEKIFTPCGLVKTLQKTANNINFKVFDGSNELAGKPDFPHTDIDKAKGPIVYSESFIYINRIALYLKEYQELQDRELKRLNYSIKKINPPLEDLFEFSFMMNLLTIFYDNSKTKGWIRKGATKEQFLTLIKKNNSERDLFILYLKQVMENYLSVDKFLKVCLKLLN